MKMAQWKLSFNFGLGSARSMLGSEDVAEDSDDMREACSGQEGDIIVAGSSWYVTHKWPMGSITVHRYKHFCTEPSLPLNPPLFQIKRSDPFKSELN